VPIETLSLGSGFSASELLFQVRIYEPFRRRGDETGFFPGKSRPDLNICVGQRPRLGCGKDFPFRRSKPMRALVFPARRRRGRPVREMLSAEALESRRLLAYSFTLQDKTGVTGAAPTDYSIYALGFASYNFSTTDNKAYAQNAFVLGNVGGTPSATPYTFTDLPDGANPTQQSGKSTSISPVKLDASNLTFTLPSTIPAEGKVPAGASTFPSGRIYVFMVPNGTPPSSMPTISTQGQVAFTDGPTVGLGFTGFTPGSTNAFAYEALEFTINQPPNLDTLNAGSLDIDWTSVDQFQFPLTMQADIPVTLYKETRNGNPTTAPQTYHVGARNDDGSYTRNDVFAQYKTFTATEPQWGSLLINGTDGQPAGILSPLSVSKQISNSLKGSFKTVLDALYVNGPPSGQTLYLQGNETQVLWETAPVVLTSGTYPGRHALALWNSTSYPDSSAVNPVWSILDPRALADETLGSAEYQIFGGSGAFNAAYAVPGKFAGEALGTVLDMLNAAINRGIATADANSGLYGTAKEKNPSGSTNPVAASLIYWETQANFYPANVEVEQNLYAAFLHTAMINNFPVNYQNPTAPQNSAAGTPMGLAYGFSQDEAPGNNLNGDGDRASAFVNPQFGASGSPSTTLLGGQIPAVNDGTTIKLTLGPWVGSTPSTPTVFSIDTRPQEKPPGNPTPTAPGTVKWDVLFNEPVTGVSAANFKLVASAGLTGSGNIMVAPASTAPAAAWTVTASTGTGSGTLGLNLTNGASIKDASGHALTGNFTGQVYAVSDAPVGPTASIAIPANAQNPTSAAMVTFEVTFSQPVTGLTSDNFKLVASGLTPGNIQVSAQPQPATTWTVTVGTGSGSGTLGLQLVNASGITPAPTGLPVTSAAVYTINKNDPTKAPLVQSIALAGPSPTSAATVSWTVTFSEPVTGLSTANFFLVPTGLGGTPRFTGVTPASSSSTATWTVTASTGSGSGTLGLNMVNSSNVHDADSQAVTNLPFTGAAYTIRQTPVAPALQSISRNLPSPTDQPQVSWTVSFSEAVAGVTAANFSLVSTGLSGAKIKQVVQAPGTGRGWTVTALTGSGVGTLRLDMVNANRITDTEGLAPTGIPLQGQSYDVERGDVPGVRIPIAFWAEPGRRANLVWPRGLVPFTGPATRELTVTLAATGGDGSFAARRDIRGVTVAGTGTGPEISLTGTARSLNAYFRTAGRIGYTPSGESLLPRVLAVSAVTTTDTLAGFDTAAILVRGRTSPGRPTIDPQIRLGTTPADTPLEITYETLLAAANVPAAATRSVEFLLGRVSTGRLEIWDGAEYRVVVPRSPRFASRFDQPLLAPGGRIKWTPRTGQTGEVPTLTLRVWDGRLKSADVSQVFVDVTAG